MLLVAHQNVLQKLPSPLTNRFKSPIPVIQVKPAENWCPSHIVIHLPYMGMIMASRGGGNFRI